MTTPRTSDGILALLSSVAREAPAEAAVVLRAATGRGQQPGKQIAGHALTGLLEGGLLPASVLDMIESERARPWRVRLATRRPSSGDPQPLTLGVVAVSIPLRRALKRRRPAPSTPDARLVESRFGAPRDAQLVHDPEQQREIDEMAAAFLPASLAMLSTEVLTLVWALDEPLVLRRPAQTAHALRLLSDLAAHFGGTTPEDLPSAEVPLPGFAARNLAPHDVAELVRLEHVKYSHDEIRAALKASRKVAS